MNTNNSEYINKLHSEIKHLLEENDRLKAERQTDDLSVLFPNDTSLDKDINEKALQYCLDLANQTIDNLRSENIELKEKVVDYQRFIKAIRAKVALEAFEDWLSDDTEDGDNSGVLLDNDITSGTECSTQNLETSTKEERNN